MVGVVPTVASLLLDVTMLGYATTLCPFLETFRGSISYKLILDVGLSSCLADVVVADIFSIMVDVLMGSVIS